MEKRRISSRYGGEKRSEERQEKVVLDQQEAQGRAAHNAKKCQAEERTK